MMIGSRRDKSDRRFAGIAVEEIQYHAQARHDAFLHYKSR